MYSSPGQPGEVKSYCYVYLPSKYYLFFQYVNLLDGCFFLNKRTVIIIIRNNSKSQLHMFLVQLNTTEFNSK